MLTLWLLLTTADRQFDVWQWQWCSVVAHIACPHSSPSDPSSFSSFASSSSSSSSPPSTSPCPSLSRLARQWSLWTGHEEEAELDGLVDVNCVFGHPTCGDPRDLFQDAVSLVAVVSPLCVTSPVRTYDCVVIRDRSYRIESKRKVDWMMTICNCKE